MLIILPLLPIIICCLVIYSLQPLTYGLTSHERCNKNKLSHLSAASFPSCIFQFPVQTITGFASFCRARFGTFLHCQSCTSITGVRLVQFRRAAKIVFVRFEWTEKRSIYQFCCVW